jgi:acyl-[acyl-carrier-protein]-phospholipid O-acyltransferase / long-chain-fatty-acid--[acyl-carrier-protein] ligase
MQRPYVAATDCYQQPAAKVLTPAHVKRTLWQAFSSNARRYKNKPAITDMVGQNLTYAHVALRAQVVAQLLRPHVVMQQPVVGLMLPNVAGMGVVFWALQALGCVPAMLNYTAGAARVAQACKTAATQTVITARSFITQADLGTTIDLLQQQGVHIIYTEDLLQQRHMGHVLRAVAARFLPHLVTCFKRTPYDTAVIVFTSGTEGDPKGVALSHSNLLSNCYQIAAHMPFGASDVAFNALPLFHCFGLTAGFLLPQLFGAHMVLHPSPLQYKNIPPLLQKYNATIFFATDTFLRGYARYATPQHFASVWGIFAGAEPLHSTTHAHYTQTLSVPVYHGYGVTETSPVIAVNTPEHNKPASVGRPVVGLECALHAVPEAPLSAGGFVQGRLHVRGANVMQGYIMPHSNGVVTPLTESWHDTGDMAHLDAEGYLYITGRLKRFAKIGGEMVSLAAVESLAQNISPAHSHAAIATTDERKGQTITLFTTDAALTRAMLVEHTQQNNGSMLTVPAQVHVLETLPLLASGKVNYATLGDILGVL